MLCEWFGCTTIATVALETDEPTAECHKEHGNLPSKTMLHFNARILTGLFAMLSPERQEELNAANSRFFRNPKDPGSSPQPQYTSSNIWPRSSQGRKLKKGSVQPHTLGVEIRELEDPHPLSGELGLFAAQKFEMFDIVGEYIGEVFDGEGGSKYATYLEDRTKKYALGVDATRAGNESRFINHFTNIAEEPNVVMKVTYVEELPRVMVVCKKDVEIGEELLFQYSDEFVEEYFS